jgi:hypothetical protein
MKVDLIEVKTKIVFTRDWKGWDEKEIGRG